MSRELPVITLGLAVTANPASPLEQEPADATWVIPFEKVGAVPGTTSFVLGAAALYEIGCYAGGRLSRPVLRFIATQSGRGRSAGFAWTLDLSTLRNT